MRNESEFRAHLQRKDDARNKMREDIARAREHLSRFGRSNRTYVLYQVDFQKNLYESIVLKAFA